MRTRCVSMARAEEAMFAFGKDGLSVYMCAASSPPQS